MVTVAELVARLRADVTGFVAPMAAAEKQLTSVKDKATSLGTSGTAALGMFAGGADEVSSSGDKMATSWELSMGRIRAANDATVASFAKVAVASRAAAHASGGVNTQMTIRPGSGFAGGGGVATDVGSMARAGASASAGLLSALLLIFPVINTIIAGIVGLIGLLVAAAAAAAAFAAAFLGVGAAMAFAAYKWRDLLSTSTSGASSMKASLLAVEAAAFNAGKALMASFSSAGGGSFWDSFAQGAIKLIGAMQPIFAKIIGWVQNFINALRGVAGASSPFLDFLRTWIEEWKKLWAIQGQGLSGGGGIFAFFKKYEAPAKAFVEGIAQVINAIRKMSAAGLGLNMDQLAVFIKNLFHWVAAMVGIFPTFSNALVGVGLAFSKLLNQALPLIRAAFQFGVFILQYMIQPLMLLAAWITGHILTLPLLSWLVAVAGGIALVVLAIDKLSFGIEALSFKTLMTGLASMVAKMGESILLFAAYKTEALLAGTGLEGLGSAFLGTSTASTKFLSTLAGGLAIVGALALAWWALKGAMTEVAAAEKKAAADSQVAMAAFAAGQQTGLQSLAAAYKAQAAAFNGLSNGGKIVWGLKNAFAILGGSSPTVIAVGKALDVVTKSYNDLASAATSAIQTGALSPSEASGLKSLMAAGAQPKANPAAAIGPMGSVNFDLLAQIVAYNKSIDLASSLSKAALTSLDVAYQKGTINAGQYVTMLTQLGLATNSAGQKIDVYALTVQGAGDTIAQALAVVQKNADTATGGLAAFATASGQTFTQLKSAALTAMNDPMGGLMGSGAKVTEFFQQQADAISAWKANFANAMDFGKAAFGTILTTANITFAGMQKAMAQSVVDARQYSADIKTLIRKGASDQMVQAATDAGIGAAAQVHTLATGSRKDLALMGKQMKTTGSEALGLAGTVADAIGLTMEKLTTSLEVMFAKSLGISFKDLKAQVDAKLKAVGNEAGKHPIKIRTELMGPTGRLASGHHMETAAVIPKSDTAIKVTADTSLAATKVANFKTGVESGAPIKVPMGIDTGGPGMADSQLKGFTDAAAKSKPQPSLYLNTDPAHTSFVDWLTSVSGTTVNTTMIVHRKVVHSGGAIMHGGGAVAMHSGGLRADERMVTLQVGEFVMQRSAVNRIGLGTLAALNSGGPGGGLQGLQSDGRGSQNVNVSVGLERRNFMRGLDTEFSSRGL